VNLANNPNINDLKKLLAACDDAAANHVIWVDFGGKVHVTPVPAGLTPVGFEAAKKGEMKFRLETCGRGNDYVGEKAAASEKWTNELFKGLVRLWAEDYRGYCDML